MTPASVQARQFSERRKGYDPQEVDEFLDEVTHTLNDLGGRLDAAAAHVQRLQTDLSRVEAERDQLSAVPAADPGQVEALSAQVESLSAQAQDLAEQARVAEAARAAAAAGYEETSARASALAEQIEAARAAHLRQQTTITTLSTEVEYWKEQLEQERQNARPPVELERAVEVLAAAQATAERMRHEADQDALQVRERADAEVAQLCADVNAEAERMRAEFAALRDAEQSMRADVAALADNLLEILSGDSLVQLPEVPSFGEVERLAPEGPAKEALDEVLAEQSGALEAALADRPETDEVLESTGVSSDFGAWSAPVAAADDTAVEATSFVEASPADVVDDTAVPQTDVSSDFGAWSAPALEATSAEVTSVEVAVDDSVWGAAAEESVVDQGVSDGFGAWGAPSSAETAPIAVVPDVSEEPVVDQGASEGFGAWGAPVSAEPAVEQAEGQSQESDPYGFGG